MQAAMFHAAATVILLALLPTSLAQFNLNIVHWGDLHGRCGASHVHVSPVVTSCKLLGQTDEASRK
jgi:aerobic-type carbon monoxide dehydrogenase small subunit (CoxS/CutS family)